MLYARTYLASLFRNQELGSNRKVNEICTKSVTVISIGLCGCFVIYVAVLVICVCVLVITWVFW